jgi:hypothetical protein
MSTPGMYSFLCKITQNSKKIFVGQVTFGEKVILHYIRVQKNVFTIWCLLVSKDAEFNVDFKHINLTKMHLKKVIQEKRISTLHRGPPVYIRNSFFLNNFIKNRPILLCNRKQNTYQLVVNIHVFLSNFFKSLSEN